MKKFLVSLITMPFGSIAMPALGPLQLRAVLQRRFGEEVECRVVMGNNRFAKTIGMDVYQDICMSWAHLYSGLGDWLFSETAFESPPSPLEKYLKRFYPGQTNASTRERIEGIRKQIPAFLEELVEEHRLYEADLCGFTSTFAQTCASIALANVIKRRNPSAHIVLGGANGDAPMGGVLLRNVPALDAVFSGPSLRSFPEHIGQRMSNPGKRPGPIPGVTGRGQLPVAGGALIGEELDINEDLELDYSEYLDGVKADFGGRFKPTLAFETSRGCWWGEKAHCTFCGLNAESMSYRSLDSERAVGLFARLFDTAPDAGAFFAVDNIIPQDYPTKVLPKITPPEGSYIFYEVKANLTREEMSSMAKSSVRVVQPGVEAMATSTLKLMRKGTTAFSNVNFLARCKEFGITPQWNLLMGFPGEEESVFRKYLSDIPLLVHLPPPSGAFMVRFDRFSPYFMKAEEYGLELQPLSFYQMVYPFSRQDLGNLAYYFEDANKEAQYKQVAKEWVGTVNRAVQEQWRRRWAKGETRPKLEFACDESLWDSRFAAEPRRVVVGRAGARLLKHLSKRSVKGHSAVTEARRLEIPDPEQVIARLHEAKLLFEEGGRVLSLVVPEVS